MKDNYLFYRICKEVDKFESNIGGLQQDVYFRVDNDLEFDWLEEAIKYCLEN